MDIKAILEKGNIKYIFHTEELRGVITYVVKGEESLPGGGFRCISYKEVSKETGNKIYKKLISQGYTNAELPQCEIWQ